MWRSPGVLPFCGLLLVLTGCGGGKRGGQPGGTSVPRASPGSSNGPGLGYAGPAVFQLGVHGLVLPDYASGGITVTASPALPAGLTFDSEGAIAGTPTALSAAQHYTVSAVSSDGSTTTDLLLEVNDGPLFYSSPAILQVGIAMAPLVPTGTQGLSGYTVNPPLPPGLSFDSMTGIISGTPTETSPASYYTIVGADSGFSREYGLTLAVADPSATNPIASSAAFDCVHSGEFIGTFPVDPADQGYGLIAISFLWDGTATVVVHDLSTQSGAATQGVPALDASMDGGFTINFPTQPAVSVHGSFSRTDFVSGAIQHGPITKSFTAARIGGSSTAQYRYSDTGGPFSDFAAVDVTGSALTGVVYTMSTTGSDFVLLNDETSFQATIANGSFTVMVGDDRGTYPYTAAERSLVIGDGYLSEFTILTAGFQLN